MHQDNPILLSRILNPLARPRNERPEGVIPVVPDIGKIQHLDGPFASRITERIGTDGAIHRIMVWRRVQQRLADRYDVRDADSFEHTGVSGMFAVHQL